MHTDTHRSTSAGTRVAGVLFLAALVCLPASAPRAAQDLLEPTRQLYASLKSYADEGTVTYEFGPSDGLVKEQHTFTTRYRGPRHFRFEFTKDPKINDERFVVWGDDEAFHTWWSTTGLEEAYPRGSGATAFAVSGPRTVGTSVMVAAILFAGAGLQSALTELTDATDAGVETVDGRRCRKLTGVARSVYPETGYVTNVRRTTVWIDAESGLVRKVFEDTPRGTPNGTVLRITTTFVPRANPALSDSQLGFTPPPGP